MFEFLKKFFEEPSIKWVRLIEDPILGTLKQGEETNYWAGQLSIDGQDIGIEIGGDANAPDVLLAQHAREIIQSFSEFKDMVRKFIENDANEHLEYADEINSLEIDSIYLWWPNRPNDGMIFFKGGNEFRGWRCDYIDRKPKYLGFDS